MALETWLLFVAVSLLPAISPGPAVLLALSNAFRFGASSVLYSALGNMIGLNLLGFAVAFGLAAIMQTSALVFTAAKIVGAAYLCYLGWGLIREGKSFEFEAGGLTKRKGRLALLLEALAVSLTNPKALVILAALIPPFVNRDEPVIPQVAIMSATYAGLCFLNHLAIALAGGHVRRFFASERRTRLIRRSLGLLFIAFGAALAAARR